MGIPIGTRISEGVAHNINANPNTRTGSSDSSSYYTGGNQTAQIDGWGGNQSSSQGTYSQGGQSYGGSYGGGSSYDGGSYDYWAAAQSQAAAEAAARAEAERRLAEAREKARNEKLAREKDAKIASEARNEQAERSGLKTQQAASMSTSQRTQQNAQTKEQAAKQQQQRQRVGVQPISVEEVADMGEVLEAQPETISENLGFIDTETGEVVNTTPDRAYVPTEERKGDGKPGRPRAQDEMSRSEIAAMVDALTPQVDEGGPKHMVRGKHMAPNEASGHRERYFPSAQDVMDSMQMASSELAAEEDLESGTTNFANPVPPTDPNNPVVISPQDMVWRGDNDITGMNGERAQKRKIVGNESDRQSLNYDSIRESDSQENSNFDAQDKGYVDFDFDADESESHLRRRLMAARNMMYQRFLNPALLRIEGEYIETRTENVNGRKRTYGRLRYTDRVEGSIGAVRRMYNCSIYNVMQLVQLRAGLGVDASGKIAHVDPNEFSLTEDQFVELCRDICESQRQNGHPLGNVTGKPGANGVRDDTGRYVVVAKTRCFPMGYMPRQLMADLRRDWNSQLHHMSERQIAQMIGEEWLNTTYPTLCANTGGNLMFQARAIENMMRGLMMVDGKNPSDLDIPEVIERKTLMMLRAEEMSTTDPAINEANEEKRQKIEDAVSRWTHKWKKRGGSRFADGDVESAAMKRRRNKIGDAFRTLNMLERAAKAANIGIMISNIPEGLIANRMQAFANVLSSATFRSMHKDIAKNYEVTAGLEALAKSKEAIEAREVAESLYRIGGHDAIDVFLEQLGDDGKSIYKLTKSDLNKFMREWGIVGDNPTISDRVRQVFKIGEGQEAGFLSNVSQILEGAMLGSGMFKESESKQFIQMSMAEMARASLHGRESYTNSQVEDWGNVGGGEELVRSLLKTDAGREAFMTQGITSLGRKSPIEHQLRLVMAKNGLTEFAVRTMFDRFPEYGVNKVLQMIPFSNTMSYLTAHGVNSVGSLLAAASANPNNVIDTPNFADAMQRNLNYQAGARMSFAEGLRKNIMYDTIMAGEKLLIAAVYCGVIMALGGLQPPDDEKDRLTWSEWKIGNGPDALPLKWAWWMDDLSGVGLPLGMSWALCMQNDFSDDSKKTATGMFINAIANFNSGTALFDAIDLVNNFDLEWDAVSGDGIYGYDVSRDEWTMTMLEQGFWDVIGDMTPTFIGQLIPWSKDYILAGDRDAHTASKVYDVGEGSQYSMEEAVNDYKTKRTGSYQDYMRRRSSQTNVLEAMFNDWIFGAGGNDSAITGYKYTEQPLDTMVDPYMQAMYDRFSLDLDPRTSNLPIEQADREAELDARASTVCQWIDDHYQNTMQANLDGFVLNYDARVNCINYCYKKINEAWDQYNESTSHGWLPTEQYQQVVQDRQDKIDHYKNLIYNYFQSDDIPWTMPRYVRQESDRETRYVDANGNAMTYLDTLGPNAQAEKETYWYGNTSGILPAISPRTADKGYNYETIPYWMVLDENGNPVNDAKAAYDHAAELPMIRMGRNTGKDVQELMWGGQGTNLKDSVSERLNIPRGGVATIGDRPWRKMEETFPESLKNLDAETVSKLLGIPSSLPTDEDKDTTDSKSGGTSGGKSYGGGGYSRRSYGGGGGGYYYGGGSYYGGSYGGGSSEYNPKIYSNPRQVYSDRASGLQTRQPYKATNTYLRPNFYTKGSREAYKRSDI